jgi:hypothetical protein
MKEQEIDAAGHIRAVLRDVPFLQVGEVRHEPLLGPPSVRPDFQLDVMAHGRSHRLVCEVKPHGQPRTVRDAAVQLRYYCDHIGEGAYGVLIAPFLSEASQRICKEHVIGFADFEGNCRLVFDGVFIERLVAGKPPAERRDLRSVFAPKSAQVLRVLMRHPARRWKVTELANEAGVSLGHVSNVRTALLEREWAQADSDGLWISNPDALIDTWRGAYRRPGKRHAFYTSLHGKALQEAVRGSLLAADSLGGFMLGSFSAAQWLAPYARAATEFFYADRQGLNALQDALQLSSIAKGENVIVMELEDDGLFRDALEPAPGVRCTGIVQTYLDLWISGERGREAAEHLRKERLQWNR